MQIQTPPPQVQIFEMVMSFFRSRTLQVFAELRVADAIHEGRDPGVNERFLKAAAAIGLLEGVDGGRFQLTPVGEMLRSGTPGSMRDFATSILSGIHYQAWGNLAYSARTEGNAVTHTCGEDVWAYFTKTNPDEGHVFNGAMRNMSEGVVQAILEVYELPESGVVVDVAGGVGAMLCAFLKKQPGLTGIVTDLEFLRSEAEAYISGQGLAERCQFQIHNFFESIPGGGDIYTMKWILHDWSDEKSGLILRRIHESMPAHAKLVLFEAVVPERLADAGITRMMDLNMMVMCGGKERTQAEWEALLNAHGFRLDRVIPTPTPNFVLEASRV